MQRRFAASKALINGISDQPRVQVLGEVAEVNGNVIVLKDSTGQKTFIFSEPTSAKKGQTVRIFGTPSGQEVSGELIQDMEKIDKGVYDYILAAEAEDGC